MPGTPRARWGRPRTTEFLKIDARSLHSTTMTRSNPTTPTPRIYIRVMTLASVVILACITTLLVYPAISDHWMLRRATTADAPRRAELVNLLVYRTETSADSAKRMQAALESDDDAIFATAALVLRQAGMFNADSQSAETLARYQLVEYRSADHPLVRYYILHEACLMPAGLDALKELSAVAAADEHPDLRELAAVLAAKVGDIESLQQLADDEEPLVRAAARRCSELANPGITFPLHTDDTMRLRPSDVTSAETLLMGAEYDLPHAAELAREVLTDAVQEDSQVTAAQLRAAIAVIERLNVPARDEIAELMQLRWDPALEQEMVDAARGLGQQADLEQECETTRDECIRLLQRAVMWSVVLPREEGKPMVTLQTPLASASAALALWKLDTKLAEDYLRYATENDKTLPGDYVAWHVATENPTYGMELGAKMLPRLGASPAERVYNDNERAAGAMMLALSARTDDEKAFAIERITERLGGDGAGGEDSPYVRGAYQGALLMLGDESQRETVRTLLTLQSFPQRRALTSLLVARDEDALRWLVWNPQMSDESILQLLAGRRLDDVLGRVTDLPGIDIAAPNTVRLEAIARLRAAYAIGQPADVWTPLHPETDTGDDE
jgi:hypothetical protein